ncbi:MAG: hypothetical protein ACOC97_03185 [Myxococcota bacterium]
MAGVFAGATACAGTSSPESYPPPLPSPEVLREDTAVGDLRFAAGTELQRDFDGRVRRGTLAEDHVVSDLRLPAGTVVWLQGGNVIQASAPVPLDLGGLRVERRAPIRFPHAEVWDTYEVCLAEPVASGDRRYEAGAFVEVRWKGAGTAARVMGRSEVDMLMEQGGLGAGCRPASRGEAAPAAAR